ncbi:amine flavin-containing superfamily protein [Apiospora arundinis]
MKCLVSLIILFASIALGSTASSNTDPAKYDSQDVIYRDVVVVGGGSSGVYSSMRLRDHGKTVMIIEKKAMLGGHAEAWVDPLSGTPVDMGVAVFANMTTVIDYFARFNLSLAPMPSAGIAPTYVDFNTGKKANFTDPDIAAFDAALDGYLAQLNQYPELQDSFNMTYPVHPDLLLSFGDFVAKYELQGLVSRVFLFNQGAAPLLNISMLYIFKYLNSDQVNSFKNGYLIVNHHSATELYRRAAESLGPDVLFNSTVTGMDRSLTQEVHVAVSTPEGPKLVIAKKLLSSIPPILDNLGGYDLSTNETDLFGQFIVNGYYTGVLNNTGFGPGALFANHRSGQPYGVPELPGIYTMPPSPLPDNRSVTNVYYGSPNVLADEQVKNDIVKAVQRYQAENGLPITEPDWLKFSSHAPFNLMVPNDKIADGFYSELFCLQGQRNTFYNGAAWHAQDSSVLWRFTDTYIIPILLASMQEEVPE